MREPQPTSHPLDAARQKPVLITGGAGFIGSNLAQRLLSQGRSVILLDNLCRAGVESNAAWLASEHGTRVQLVEGDTRDAPLVRELVSEASAVFHLAAQVAVTTSLVEPQHDFEVNLRGTLHVLEALRGMRSPPPLLFTSTNKVYGDLANVPLSQDTTRYHPTSPATARRGVDELCPLDFHSPYGCSKGASDQYVLDYARSFGLRTTVFRMSCIYGPRQFGTEDQGWVAHFLLKARAGEPITIYGNGKQVRDVLFVSDLVDAMMLVHADPERVAGRAFNIGGGPANTLSLLELLELIARLEGRRPTVHFAATRTGDQRYYVSDTTSFRECTGWQPRVGPQQGVEMLHQWLIAQQRHLPVDVPADSGPLIASHGAPV